MSFSLYFWKLFIPAFINFIGLFLTITCFEIAFCFKATFWMINVAVGSGGDDDDDDGNWWCQ
jgi:hypothetical protein